VTLVASTDEDPGRVTRAAARVARTFEREEQRFSRFRPDSELSLVNANAGRWTRVSKPFAALTHRALRAARETDGLYDPTVLPALKAVGYDRDYAEIRAAHAPDDELRELRRDIRALLIKEVTACGSWRDVEIDGDFMRLPAGSELDFGGIAKGWTVDAAMHVVSDLAWAIVDAGGDLRISGHAPKDGLDIAVEEPEAPGTEIVRLRVRDGALATTSVRVRSWGAGLHHVIDPRTALPSLTPVTQATVWAPRCTDAEVWSKAAVLGGTPVLDRVSAMLVMQTGEVVTSFDEAPPIPAEAIA
jgi:FAD:protein FMN transferase